MIQGLFWATTTDSGSIGTNVKGRLILNQSIHSYEKTCAQLEQENILADGAEVHGILVGMLAGGMPLESREWLEAMADFINAGEPLSPKIKNMLIGHFNETCQQLLEPDFALVLCLPDDAAPINDRGVALTNWVQGFMLGFGLFQADLTGCSEDVKEALQDFAEIARMNGEMDEDEESEQALFEVMEYVRVSSMLCFNEMGKSAASQQDGSQTVH